jgi:hypothetical protein
MKRAIRAFDKIQLRRNYPLADLVDDRFFRCKEISPGGWQVEGTDVWGRTVSATGADPERIIEQCVADAKANKAQVG